MTEAYTSLENTVKYYGNDTHPGAHFSFNFALITDVNENSTAQDFVLQITDWIRAMENKRVANWVVSILRNYL